MTAKDKTPTGRRPAGARMRTTKTATLYHATQYTIKTFRLYADRGGFLYLSPLREVQA